jgi:hypothetical protein
MRFHECCSSDGFQRIAIDHRWTWPMLLPALITFEMGVTLCLCVAFGSLPAYFQHITRTIAISLGILSATFLTFAILWCTVPDSSGQLRCEQSPLAWMLFLATATAAAAAATSPECYFPDGLLVLGASLLASHLTDLFAASGIRVSAMQVRSSHSYLATSRRGSLSAALHIRQPPKIRTI